ncbi:Aminopeptidase Ey [Chionoecetes opilio]|uniref:Aminopeptidase n=1 Tax=Chionoecetes opilio TaxID=41210 RepID=A0A8J4Y452_CHIOP|nr:Aminopeptidase Ey [Chionoecetes opilio]
MTYNGTLEGHNNEIFATTASLDGGLPSDDPSPEEFKAIQKKDRMRMGLAIGGCVLSIAIIVAGFALGAVAKENKGGGEVASTFRLPTALRPTEYQIRLQPFLNGNYSIAGHVQVELQVLQPTRNITIHLADIITHNDTVQILSYKPKEALTEEEEEEEGEGEEVTVTRHEYDLEKQWYVAHLAEELQVGQRVVLAMAFTGLLNDKMKGFYRSSYDTPEGDTVRLAATFLSPINARRVFPCLDEPAMKARFKMSLARQDNMTALANMPLLGSEPVPGQAGWVWDHFQTTVPMSTYIVAFVVSDFNHTENGNFSVWSRGAVLEEAKRALEIGPQLLSFFAEYLGVAYPLPKMDMVALPDFAAGAMENWGLVTYREETMLLPVGGAGASAVGQQRVAVVVAHELAHQWFGNLVTAQWWTDILLKEGMAAFMENVGMDALEPSWGLLDQMVLTMQTVMVADGLPSTHPVHQSVDRPADIGQIFDSITYSKGVSVIRMMSNFLTEETFKRGLVHYFEQFAYDVATQGDFWILLTSVALEDDRLPPNVTVTDIMDPWTVQAGYPVVTVTRAEDGRTANVTQERFLLYGNTTGKAEEEGSSRWWVPLSYTSAVNPNFTQTRPNIWMPRVASIILENLPAKDHWIFFNLQGTGYYRINYDDDNWATLNDQLLANHSVLDAGSRAQLLDDALSLARGGRLNYTTALGLMGYLAAEEEYVPWRSALNGLSYLEKMLTRTARYGDLKRYLLSLVGPLYDGVGFEDDLEAPHLEQLKRGVAVAWACKLGLHDCLTRAVTTFQTWITNDTAVSPNIKTTVYCVGVAEGGEGAWDAVWARYLEEEGAREKIHLMKALGCSKEPWILARYLDKAFTEGGGIRKQDASSVFASVSSNDLGRTLAWNFLRSEWDRIVNYYDTFSSAASFLTSATAEINTRIEQRELETFCRDHEASLSTSSRAVKIALENAAGNVAWMENYYEVIEKWLQENVEEVV